MEIVVKKSSENYPDFYKVVRNINKKVFFQNYEHQLKLIIKNISFTGYIDGEPLARAILFESEDFYYFGFLEFTDNYLLFEKLMDELLKSCAKQKKIIGPINETIEQDFRFKEIPDNELNNNPIYYHQYMLKYNMSIYKSWTSIILNMDEYHQQGLNDVFAHYNDTFNDNEVEIKRLSLSVFNKHYLQISTILCSILNEDSPYEYFNIKNLRQFIFANYDFILNKKSYVALKDDCVVGFTFVTKNFDFLRLSYVYEIKHLYSDGTNKNLKQALLYNSLKKIKKQDVKLVTSNKNDYVHIPEKFIKNSSVQYLYIKKIKGE